VTRPPSPETLDVVFVCTGNQARSPLAAALFRMHCEPNSVAVRSVGTQDVGRAPALPEAIDAGNRLGVDLSGHVAHGLERGALQDADLVLGFERHHLVDAAMVGNADPGRTFLLGELVALLEDPSPKAPPSTDGARFEIADADSRRRRTQPDLSKVTPDPVGKPGAVMDRTAGDIDALVRRLARSLFPYALHETG
jgi:protein-tyrosine phosphatase